MKFYALMMVPKICGKNKIEKPFNYLYLGRFFKLCPKTNCCSQFLPTYTV